MANTLFRRLLFGGVFAVGVGCGGSDLGASRPELRVGLQKSPMDAANPYRLQLLGRDAEGGCLSVSLKTKATMNGKRMLLASPGGETGFMEKDCAMVVFHGPSPAETDEVTTFEIDDDGKKYVAEFQNLRAPLSLHSMNADLWPGEYARLDWKPATFKGGYAIPQPRLRDSAGQVYVLGARWGEGNRDLIIQIPSGVALGSGSIELGPLYPAVTRCDFGLCGAEGVNSAELPVTIVSW